MEEKTFSEILSISSEIAKTHKVDDLRDLSKEFIKEIIKQKKGVFIIYGIRGSGKTTILSEIYHMEKDSLFVNIESILKYGLSLLDFLNYAHLKGYKTFLLDEIHSLKDWEKDIKIFYDQTKEKIVLSGSSQIFLKAKGSELSRRVRSFNLLPLSFREYIYFKTGKKLPKIKIENIINYEKRKPIEKELSSYVKFYNSFVNFDAIPAAYFDKNPETYINILERTIRYDLASLRKIDMYYIENLFRLVKIIATTSPGEISFSGLSSSLGIGIKLVKAMIDSLEQTGVIYKIPPKGIGKKAIRKEEKILMPLSFRSALCNYYNAPIPKGSLREDFFIQHVQKCFYKKTGKERRTPDFVIGNYIFEVGGPSKNFEQIKDFPNSFLVKESIVSSKKEIPLYLFGMLY